MLGSSKVNLTFWTKTILDSLSTWEDVPTPDKLKHLATWLQKKYRHISGNKSLGMKGYTHRLSLLVEKAWIYNLRFNAWATWKSKQKVPDEFYTPQPRYKNV